MSSQRTLMHSELLVGSAAGSVGWAELVRDLRVLAERADALGLPGDETACEAGDQPDVGEAHALLRLVGGRPHPGDESLLSVPIPGSRVFYVQLAPPGRLDDVIDMLRRDRRCCVARHDRNVCVVLIRGFPRRSDDSNARGESLRVAAQLVRVSHSARIGISAAVEGADALPAAFADAADAALLPSTCSASPGFAEDDWAAITLRRLQRQTARSLCSANPLARLVSYDMSKGTELRHTVAIWLRHDRDTVSSAAALNIHPNTLRYRLARAARIGGFSLHDRLQRLVLELILAGEPPVNAAAPARAGV